jgi:hypothetical protein
VGPLRHIADSHSVGQALNRTVDALTPLAKGQNEATRELIARALMSSNPQEALAPVLRQEMSSQNLRRIFEAFLRNGGQEQFAR